MANPFTAYARRVVTAFQQAYVTYKTVEQDDFEDYNARILRYSILFSMYENTMLESVRSWSVGYRTQYSLYKYVRNIYNPAYRLGEFWRTVVWGGMLDEEAGEQGAIPILGASSSLRTAIATVWKDSNMTSLKDIATLWGCTMGDAGIKIVDSPDKGRVYLKKIHPDTIRDISYDDYNQCQGYVLEENRKDETGRDVSFVEVCERGTGDNIIYKTYRDGELYPWNGKEAQWIVPYGFVPFVMFKQNDVGTRFGWAEIQAQRSKVHEVDEQASKLHDYIRKAIDPVWMFNFKKPKKGANIKTEAAESSESNPQPGREELPAIYVPDVRAKAQPLVTDLINIESVLKVVNSLIAELERELPELQMDIWTAGGYTTGKALRTARQRVERKVIQRRPGYDTPLVQAHQMAVAIGGERGYEGFGEFDLGSYSRGELNHSISAERPVFDTDALEAVERKEVFWRTVLDALNKGVGPEGISIILQDLGWSEQKASKFVSELPEETPDENQELGDSNEDELVQDEQPVDVLTTEGD